MSCDAIGLAKPHIQQLQPYQPGKSIDEIQRELGLEHIIKLASNENPLGLSDKVKVSLMQSINELTRYPDSSYLKLTQKLAENEGVKPEQITLGNGSNEILDLLALCFLTGASSAVYSEHGFIVYPIAIQTQGARKIEVPAKDYGHDLAAMLQAIESDTKLIFIANPNNPTGTWFNEASFIDFMQQVPQDVIVVLDEAYAEYIEPEFQFDIATLIARFTNLVVTRTFSKAYGLAGFRVGYSVSHADIANLLHRVRAPFNINQLAYQAAIAVLDDSEYLVQVIAVNLKGMQQLEQGFISLGLDFIKSKANFITFDTKTDATALFQSLLEEGVIVRPIGVYGLPQHLRVSIGLEHENRQFLDTLARLIQR